jgi:hypothetical protein
MSNSLYNHAFNLAFEVPHSPHEDGYECLEKEKQKVRAALLKRVYSIFGDSNEYLEAMGCIDSFREPDRDCRKQRLGQHRHEDE